ncbi:MATE family efflux transporter [Flavobacterium tructae]|uniref:Multidrug-efflux transporter n=1 Tax=Flavobacterium tructae TaxID=1114873 RepID=A0A1S1J732_9FLAO|nr:MATE family efflux transporter [Flavobacterium tructae]MDL2140971.1 MATE family efflux transporter [Flavobacterium tructae]OHT46462.1 MATE family efflux transporter [Flavobacterium tructae]OXB22424.1 MATE family efflux transporter [Flavobacterium tructae]OXB24072.1 MATE family efflux transporter [Flavobacterium tructae]
MTETTIQKNLFSKIYTTLKQALQGDESFDYTAGSIKKAVILLAIPMVLEMMMESVFALVDLYFVGHLEHSSFAIQTVGLTESVLTIIYSIDIGLSMAATAVVARRIGEKDPVAAAKAGMQAIVIAFVLSIFLSIFGIIYAKDILLLMGASADAAEHGFRYTQIMIGSSLSITLLFLINGIFRGAGNAAIAMKSLWIANICNIILCPILINGFAEIPALGLLGAAIATTTGRSIGVLYQIYHLFYGNGVLKIKMSYLLPDFKQINALVKIAAPGVLQFVIASCSWIFLAQLVATTGGDHGSAGYQTALRIMMFFILPAWGLSNAAATLVGQNLGAKQIERAEKSVYTTAKYNVIFMATIMIITLCFGEYIISFFTNDEMVKTIAVEALQIMSIGFIFYGIGMVLINTFNGAGDTWTPTGINFFGFWLFQIPLAFVLAKHFNMGPKGVFIAIPVAETAITLAGIFFYKKGKWKRVQV